MQFFKQSSRCNSGNITFQVLIVLPVALTFILTSFDLVRWQALKQKLQSETDKISLLAAKSLPNKTKAEEVATKKILELKSEIPNLDFNLNISEDEIAVNSSAKLGSFLSSINEELFKVNQYSSIIVRKQDVALVIPDSSSLKPPKYDAWGDSVSWPAASYFDRVSLPCEGEEVFPEFQSICQQNIESDFRRWATQNCFNPVYSKLKEVAGQVSEFILSFEQNRLSIIFMPGDLAEPGYFKGRSLGNLNDNKSHFWSSYYDKDSQLSDESCIYFSDQNISFRGSYQKPKLNKLVPSSNLIFQNKFPILPPVHFHQERINPDYLANDVNFFDLIYYRRARESSINDKSFIISFKSALCEITEGCGTFTLTGLENLNKRDLANKKIIILTDFLPDSSSSEFDELISKVSELDIKTYIYSFKHQGLSETQSELLEQRAYSLFLKEEENEQLSVSLSDNLSKLQSIMEASLTDELLKYEINK